MLFATVLFHVLCLGMFLFGGYKSRGQLNVWAFIATLGLLLLAFLYTGILGSFVALF